MLTCFERGGRPVLRATPAFQLPERGVGHVMYREFCESFGKLVSCWTGLRLRVNKFTRIRILLSLYVYKNIYFANFGLTVHICLVSKQGGSFVIGRL